ncbi:MAG: Lrp/AsnC family transcriptional regulator, partial [candidate division WOR-3 bacterium]
MNTTRNPSDNLGGRKQITRIDPFSEITYIEAIMDNDPYAYYPEKPEESKAHPSYFNPLKIENFYKDSVPIIFQRFTNIPDSLLNTFTVFNLDRVSILILLLLHKNTLGFLHPKEKERYQSDRVIRTNKMPANHIIYQFGPKYDKNNMKVRSRFLKTTIRMIAEALNTSKSTVHRKIQKLHDLKLIQIDSNKHYGSIIGINYLTIEAICGGKSVAYQISSSKKKSNKNHTFTTVRDTVEKNKNAGFIIPSNDGRFIDGI